MTGEMFPPLIFAGLFGSLEETVIVIDFVMNFITALWCVCDRVTSLQSPVELFG